MKLIKPSYEIIPQAPGLEGIYKQIELAGRVCYKSEDKITEDSAKDFTDRMIKSEHCYTADSEVLTEKGWLKWSNYKGEKIAVINHNREFIGYETPSRIISHKYYGNFYYYPELGLKVTDGHNMFGTFRTSQKNFYNDNNYHLFSCNTKYKDNNNREKTLGERTFKVPTNCVKPLVTDPYYELIGFWLGDGCYSPEITNKLVFHLKKQRKIQYLKQLCNDLNFILEEGASNRFKVKHYNIGKIFNSLFYNNGKIIQGNYTPIQIHSIIQGLINSDGSIGTNTKTITFTNTSISIINWIMQYAPLAGYNITNCGICYSHVNHNLAYKILFKDTKYVINNDSRKPQNKVQITKEELDVYCVTVSTGLILVRGNNGQTSICGNCAMCEHGTVYLHIKFNSKQDYFNSDLVLKYHENPYSKIIRKRDIDNDILGKQHAYITTNYRVLIENNWLDDLKYLCEPTEYHEKRVTVKFITDIGCGREILRHRLFSYANESTRYCNYSRGKFNNELTYIIPSWSTMKSNNYNDMTTIFSNKNILTPQESCLLLYLKRVEEQYMLFVENDFKPQEARAILPLCTKSELVVTGFVTDWKHFFDLRTDIAKTGKPHPDLLQVTNPLYNEFINLKLI